MKNITTNSVSKIEYELLNVNEHGLCRLVMNCELKSGETHSKGITIPYNTLERLLIEHKDQLCR